MRVFNPDSSTKTIDQLSEDLSVEMHLLIAAIKPFAYSRSDVQQGRLALVLERAERAASQLKAFCCQDSREGCFEGCGEKTVKQKRAPDTNDVDYTYLVVQLEEADTLFAKAHKLLRKPLAVSRVEGNVVHLGVDTDAADVQRVDYMLKALEIEILLSDDDLSVGREAEKKQDKLESGKPFLRLV